MSEYWKNFWNNNSIIHKTDLHSKVGRTIAGIPINENNWLKTVDYITVFISPVENSHLLDIAAGSGALAKNLAPNAKSYTAIDISESFVNELNKIQGVNAICNDILKAEFKEQSFDTIFIYFAIQHFSESETVQLIQKCFQWLKKGGKIYIGDIPDVDKLFNFFNTKERKQAYFNSLEKQTPIIGTWYKKKFYQHLGGYFNFSNTQILIQPEYQINAHYRFDVLYTK
jgi:ubiquinone/menaquinone biosynthesis C-methylase UbiE